MFISPPPENDDVRRVYQSSVDSQGFLMNLTKLWAWRPEVFEDFAALRSKLMSGSALSKRDFAVMVSALAAELGDSYCALAWGSTLAKEASPAVAAAVLKNGDAAAQTPRDRALAAWARKLVDSPTRTGPADVTALHEAGLAERDIVEATMFIAFRIAFSTVNNALGAAPDHGLVEGAPAEVVQAVSFGRPADPASAG